MRLLPVAGMVIAYCIAANAMATDYKAGSLAISGPWSRATPEGRSSWRRLLAEFEMIVKDLSGILS